MPAQEVGYREFIAPGVLSDGNMTLSLSDWTPADQASGSVPTYRFEMKVADLTVGGIRFRAGINEDIVLYAGNLGYNVHQQFRGQRFAERACKLLLPFAIRHGLKTLWITCDPDNSASRRTCERLGAMFVNCVPLPVGSQMYEDGEREKCRYCVDLSAIFQLSKNFGLRSVR